MPSEAQARITINRLLEDAGWRFHPDARGQPANVVCEHRVTRNAITSGQDLGNDCEHAPQGFVDCLLLNTDQRPVAVVEAKRESIDPLTAKEQARTLSGQPAHCRSIEDRNSKLGLDGIQGADDGVGLNARWDIERLEATLDVFEGRFDQDGLPAKPGEPSA